MTTTSGETLRDPKDTVRGAVARVEEELGRGDCPPSLKAAVTALVESLALGPAPRLRRCPACGGIGMLAATRCGDCWRPLTPPLA